MYNKLRSEDQVSQNSSTRVLKITIIMASLNSRIQKQKRSIPGAVYCFSYVNTNHPQVNNAQIAEGYWQTYDSIKMPSDEKADSIKEMIELSVSIYLIQSLVSFIIETPATFSSDSIKFINKND